MTSGARQTALDPTSTPETAPGAAPGEVVARRDAGHDSRALDPLLDSEGLNIALAEAVCLGSAFDPHGRTLCLELEVLRLPETRSGVAAEHRDGRVRLTLRGVGRVAASLRSQRWNHVDADILPLAPDTLDQAIKSFGGGRLHGWEFVDVDDSGWSLWRELLSFDAVLDTERPSAHVFEFSQEEGVDPRELDVRVWFDELSVHDATGAELSPAHFVADGKRWWAAHDAGDPRAVRPGIAPPL
ncbi:hypothetical protein [Nocardia harenae]|uniref:hypothetical protein n=1 Tax=Nocardia harenae TaxID=358707 RepID=UPI000A039E91|nr:hypothetical protein [Nocardia harenae]